MMRILIATGGAAHSDKAVQMGAQIAGDADFAPTLLTVIKHEAEYSHAEAILARAVFHTSLDTTDVRTRIRVGNPAKEIIREAEEGNYDLVNGERWKNRLRSTAATNARFAFLYLGRSASVSIIVKE